MSQFKKIALLGAVLALGGSQVNAGRFADFKAFVTDKAGKAADLAKAGFSARTDHFAKIKTADILSPKTIKGYRYLPAANVANAERAVILAALVYGAYKLVPAAVARFKAWRKARQEAAEAKSEATADAGRP